MQPREAGPLRDDITTCHRRFLPACLPFNLLYRLRPMHPNIQVERQFPHPPQSMTQRALVIMAS